jgi:3-phenylpropionate/trans-cinnamate dioxygenase ferredoxin component
MGRWVDVARAEEFPPRTVRTIDLDGMQIAVFNLDGRYYAIEDVCTHEAETLSEGELEGAEIVCPRHGAHFSIITGEALSAPAYEPVATFRVRVEAGMVQLSDERAG